jgi:hypothetical protein
LAKGMAMWGQRQVFTSDLRDFAAAIVPSVRGLLIATRYYIK